MGGAPPRSGLQVTVAKLAGPEHTVSSRHRGTWGEGQGGGHFWRPARLTGGLPGPAPPRRPQAVYGSQAQVVSRDKRGGLQGEGTAFSETPPRRAWPGRSDRSGGLQTHPEVRAGLRPRDRPGDPPRTRTSGPESPVPREAGGRPPGPRWSQPFPFGAPRQRTGQSRPEGADQVRGDRCPVTWSPTQKRDGKRTSRVVSKLSREFGQEV